MNAESIVYKVKGPEPYCTIPALSESGFRLAAITRLTEAILAHIQSVYTRANRSQRCWPARDRNSLSNAGGLKLVSYALHTGQSEGVSQQTETGKVTWQH